MSRTPDVPGYTLVDRVHRGPHADVWRASRDGDGRPVAVKIPAPGPDGADVVAESAVLRAARHDHLVGVLDEVYLADGRAALVTDLATGGSLADLVAARGRLTWSETCAVLAPVADALWALHRQGIVHGDVSPANVLLTDDARPLLGDLGAARTHRAVTGVWGTEGFAAPELLAGGEPDAAADVFSLGAVAVHALTGQGVSPLEQVDRVLGRCTDAVDDLPDELADLLRGLLAGDPTARPRAVDAARALAQVAVPVDLDIGGPTEAQLVTYRVRGARPARAVGHAVGHTLGRAAGRGAGESTRWERLRAAAHAERTGRVVVGTALGVAAVACLGLAAPHAGVVASAVGLGAPSPRVEPVAAASPAGVTPGVTPAGSSAASSPGATRDPAADPGGAAAHPRDVLQSLLDRRAAALSAHDAAALRAVDVPDSWARRRDGEIIESLAAAGERAHGMRFEVVSAQVVSAATTRTLVQADVRMAGYSATRGARTRTVAARELAPARYTLAYRQGRWLIETVSRAPR